MKKKIVEISVKDGRAEPENIPDGVEVYIRDYDCDGAPEGDLLEDEQGRYTLTIW